VPPRPVVSDASAGGRENITTLALFMSAEANQCSDHASQQHT